MSDVQPYVFGRASAHASAMLGGLERLGDRIARQLRGLIEPYAGVRPGIVPRAIERTQAGAWSAAVPAFASLSLYRLHPIRGTVALRIDARLVLLLVDRFYGGRGTTGDPARKEFTPTENRLIGRLSTQIVDALVEATRDLVSFEAQLIGRESNITHADFLTGETQIATQGFEIDLGGREPFLVEFVYPLDALNAVEPHGHARAEAAAPHVDPVWQAQLARRMDDVRLTAKTVLARPNLKMSELVALKPGDVIPIHIGRHLPLLIGDRVFAHGSIGEQDGRAAFMIEKLA